ASSAHGKANMLRFNYFYDHDAFTRNAEDGTYRVNMDKMRDAVASLSRLILELQGNGDKEGVASLGQESGHIGAQLQADLDRLMAKGIPVDIRFTYDWHKKSIHPSHSPCPLNTQSYPWDGRAALRRKFQYRSLFTS